MVIEPAQAPRLARALWIAWAIIVWNVLFDHIIVMAGRRAVAAAGLAATVDIDGFMRPAVASGLWAATAAASVILVLGFSSIQRVRSR